jgi:hypothetical protein
MRNLTPIAARYLLMGGVRSARSQYVTFKCAPTSNVNYDFAAARAKQANV